MGNLEEIHQEMHNEAKEKLEQLKKEDLKKQEITNRPRTARTGVNTPIFPHEKEHTPIEGKPATNEAGKELPVNQTTEVKKVDYGQLIHQIEENLEKTKNAEKEAFEIKNERIRQEGVLRFVKSLQERGLFIVEV